MLPSCPPFEVKHRPYVQNPREGHVYPPPPSTAKGLANGGDPSSAERGAPSTSAAVMVWRSSLCLIPRSQTKVNKIRLKTVARQPFGVCTTALIKLF